LIAGMLAGVMLVLMGIFKFGSLITYIPRPVTIGFTSGIAIIIFTGQIENFLGLENIEKKEYFHENMLEIIRHVDEINLYSILINGMLAGVMLVLMGIFKFGSLITYIPRPVTIGFTSGIAIIIFTGQIENFLGLENIEKKEYFHENMLEIIRHVDEINLYSILI